MSISGKELKQCIESLEKLEEDIQELRDHVSDVLKEAKYKGFDTKIIKLLIKERKLETHKLEEQQSLLETYRAAVVNSKKH